MGRYLTCAETASLLRRHLKRAFPAVRFSVRSDTYSGGASIRVRWSGGPSRDEVEAVAKQYEGSDFDAMIDLKTSVSRWLLPDGTMTLAHARGTEGSRGTIPEVIVPKPHPDAEEVDPAADWVFCERADPPIEDLAKAAGFVQADTGGGCTAWEKTLTPKRYVLITRRDDPVRPTDPNEPVMVGLYDDGYYLAEVIADGFLAGVEAAEKLQAADLPATRIGLGRGRRTEA